MKIKPIVMAGMLALALSACGSKENKAAGDNAAQKAPLPDKMAIYYGTTGPTLFDVPEAYQWSIGALLQNGSNFCTGTLIAEDVVLSAAHCALNSSWWGARSVISTNGVTFGLGKDMKNPTHKIAVKQIIPHPSYNGNTASNDVALFILKEKATKYIPSLKPIPMNKSSLENFKGQIVQNVGYGSTEDNDYNTKRFWTTEEVKDVTTYDFTVNGKGKSSVCFGDSGGPSLFAIDNQIYIVGTVSWGDQSCVDNDHYARTNHNIAWIAKTLADEGHEAIEDQLISLAPVEEPVVEPQEPVVEEDLCQGYDFVGVCEGNVAKWCDNGVVYERDCSFEGQVCGYSESANGNYCLEQEEPVVDQDDPCGGITYLGVCEGDVAKWCSNGEIKQRDCANYGQNCDYIDAEWGYYCL